ncbi:MAG: membrane protein insertase YidC [Oscillospiraceae bacterium]|nr:membrane protein insertase YidC [Oscillospiraceae bacterium]
MSFLEIILYPFSWLLTITHGILGTYGFALIIFAIVVRAIMFPFSLRGKRSQIGMSMIQDQVQKIQKQYANNRTKANEEVQKLYDKEGVKPTSGCLWSLIPLLILFPLYAVIRQPITYMMHVSSEALVRVAQTLQQVGADVVGTLGLNDISEVTSSVVSSGYNEMKLAALINNDYLAAAQGAANHVAAGEGDGIFVLNFHFAGLDLSQIPQWQFWNYGSFTWAYIGLFLLPILAAVFGLATSFASQRSNRMANPAASQQMSGTMRVMMFISPLISLWIGFSYPAAMCIYWISNNILSSLTEIFSARILKKDYDEARRKKEEQERLEKEAEKKRRQEAAERKYHAMEQAKQNRNGSKKRKKKKPQPQKSQQPGNEASRVDMRRYARGRSYDPDRYGGVTPYMDPSEPIDEDVIEKVHAARAAKEKAERTKEAMRKFTEGLDLEPDEQELVDEELLRQAEQELEENGGDAETDAEDEEAPALESAGKQSGEDPGGEQDKQEGKTDGD